MDVRHLGTDKNYKVMLNLINWLIENKTDILTNTICEGFKGSESFVSNVRKVDGIEIPISMNLTLNSIDYKNFFDSYNVTSCQINKVLSFRKTKGLFNSFIDYFYEIKKNSICTIYYCNCMLIY